jgi:hypothetical protein
MPEKRFPIQDGLTIPWSLAEKAYEMYSQLYGSDQSLERLAERGGFGVTELAVLLAGRQPGKDKCTDAILGRAIRQLVGMEVTEAPQQTSEDKGPECDATWIAIYGATVAVCVAQYRVGAIGAGSALEGILAEARRVADLEATERQKDKVPAP